MNDGLNNLFGNFDISSLILASIWDARIWYAIPLVVVISLVYGATRHENIKEILMHSARSAIWVVGFMGIIFGLIYLVGFWN